CSFMIRSFYIYQAARSVLSAERCKALSLRYSALARYRFRQRRISRGVLPSAVRRAMYSRVVGSWAVLMTTAICSALLSRRSPPRLSRCLTVLPDDAGIGFTPANAAKAASERTLPRCDHAEIGRAACR